MRLAYCRQTNPLGNEIKSRYSANDDIDKTGEEAQLSILVASKRMPECLISIVQEEIK